MNLYSVLTEKEYNELAATYYAENYIKARASLGSREKFMKILDKVPEQA